MVNASTETAGKKDKAPKERLPGFREQFTTRAWALIPLGIALNFVGNTLTQVLHIPLFLNVIGTILISVLAGPWVGALTGGISGMLNNITNPIAMPFLLVQVAIALVVGYLASRGFFRTWWKAVLTGVLVAFVSVLMSTPIAVILFGGITGRGTDILTGLFLATGTNLFQSVFQTQFLIDILDKVGSTIIAYLIARTVAVRFRPKYGRMVLP